MNDDNSPPRAPRPTLKLKSGAQRPAAAEAHAAKKIVPRGGAPLRGKGNKPGSPGPFGAHSAQGADEYMQRMQADMDALMTKRTEPTR